MTLSIQLARESPEMMPYPASISQIYELLTSSMSIKLSQRLQSEPQLKLKYLICGSDIQHCRIVLIKLDYFIFNPFYRLLL